MRLVEEKGEEVDGDNSAAETGLRSNRIHKKGKENASRELSDELSGAIARQTRQDNQYESSTTTETPVRRKDKARTDKKKKKCLDENRQFRQAGQPTSFLSELSDGSAFRGSIILESNQSMLQPDASRPPCCCGCHDPG